MALLLANPVSLVPLLDLPSGLAQSRLVSPQPTTPAVFGRHDASLEKLTRGLTEMAGIAQQHLGITQIDDIQHQGPIHGHFPGNT